MNRFLELGISYGDCGIRNGNFTFFDEYNNSF